MVPPKLPEITALEVGDDGCVRPENVAVVFPVCTVTLVGTVTAAVLLLGSVTTARPEGAAAFSVSVPSKLLPALTVAVFSDIEERETVALAEAAVQAGFEVYFMTAHDRALCSALFQEG